MNRLIVVTTLLSLGLVAAPAVAQEQIDETRDLPGGSGVTVINTAGTVVVRGWNRDEVQITGELGDNDSELDIEQRGSNQVIEVKLPRGKRNVDGSDLMVRVPSDTSVEVETVSADIELGELEGSRVMSRSVSGDVDVDVSADDVELNSVSGDIEYRGRSSRTRAESVSGEVTVTGVSGELEVSSVSGEITVVATTINRGRFETVSGDVEMRAELAAEGRVSVESMSGDVVLNFSDDVDARIEANTFSGDIDSDYGSVSRQRYGPQKHLDVTVGSGSGSIRVESFSGDVEIHSGG